MERDLKKIFEYFFYAELKSAASKNFRFNLSVMFVGCLMMTLMSIFIVRDAGFGMLFAGLAFWHRYVMLKVSRVYLEAEAVRAQAENPESGNADV